MPQLQRDGDVFVLDLNVGGARDTENRFSPEWLAEVDQLLEEVLASTGDAALVTTGTGKFYSNGLDLDWLSGHLDQTASYVATIQSLLATVLTFPMVTVAAMNGHTFAGGGMLALAHDTRVMRVDRGFFCLPEVDIHIPFTAGMAALIQARLSKATAHEAMTTARRYGGTDALGAGIVDETAAEADVLGRAVARAGALTGKRGDTLAAIKTTMYGPAVRALRESAGISLGG
jgi:enoyl-CoA hydratase/carnithine racemase